MTAGWLWAPHAWQLTILAIGALLFDLGVQVTLIAHQTLVYRLDPGTRSRLNAVLFVGMFTGMASGTALGSLLLAAWGWAAVMGGGDGAGGDGRPGSMGGESAGGVSCG